jgi:Glyoxalase/Bleomycin resistance protein/Dioxygenase superfamily
MEPFQIEVEDLHAFVEQLRGEGVSFRGELVEGRGGRQILAEDPAGNLIELFQPAGPLSRRALRFEPRPQHDGYCWRAPTCRSARANWHLHMTFGIRARW